MTSDPQSKHSAAANRVVYTVSRLNQDVNTALEQQFGMLWVEGELSNFSRPGSGHYYFSLKDSRSQLRCAMFRGRNRYVQFKPEDGQKVLLRGKLGIYEARGDFQFIAEHMELAGTGALQLQFEQTKARLKEAGWFNLDLKKPIAQWPTAIGVVTSPTGAAIRDILNVLQRRYPGVSIIIYPTQVQGAAAAPQIRKSIELANRRNEVDTLIIARGGGSLEDLWAFNEESVAEAIFTSELPIISGVGHEVDYTITDMVADLRAPTPSAAAELAVPDQAVVLNQIRNLTNALQRAMHQQFQPRETSLLQLINRLHLRHPERVITQRRLNVDELEARLTRALGAVQSSQQARLAALLSRLQLASPANQVNQQLARTDTAVLKLKSAMRELLAHYQAKLANNSRALDAVSPLATLSRGYAVVRKQGSVISDAAQLQEGDQIDAMLGKGTITANVISRDIKE